MASALAGARVAVVYVGPTGIGQGQLGELAIIQAQASSDPDFRYADTLLPGVAADRD